MKNLFTIITLSILLVLPHSVFASTSYPQIANYYLNFFTARDYAKLVKYDLLILQPEMAISQSRFFSNYKKTNPDGKLLAYLYPASFYRPTLFYDNFSARTRLFEQINYLDLWLRDTDGEIISPWPQMNSVNITRPDWRHLNLTYLIDAYRLKTTWDGVFWDLVDSDATKYSTRPIDITEKAVCAPQNDVNALWQTAMADFLAAARQKLPTKILLINGDSLPAWQSQINGRMFEHFPTPWEGNGSWQASMKQYLSILPNLNQRPAAYVLNARYDKSLAASEYQQMRFGLTSALLGDGYFSFDDGAESHSQLWWYDEYDLDLGKPLTKATNSTGSSALVAPGLWLREFSKGLVLVNSSDQIQSISLTAGKYRRFKGSQDSLINNGKAVDLVELGARDGVILLKNF